MPITRRLIGLNIVLVSGNINTSLFSQYWFIKHGIVQENEFMSDSMFIAGLTNVSTNDCQITILPDKIQLALKTDNMEVAKRCVDEKFIKMVNEMDNVSINAIGLNYLWRIDDSERSTQQIGRELFCNDNELGNYFSDGNARYGAYYSKAYDDVTRLKLDIKPIMSKQYGEQTEYLLASFNYHSDVALDQMKNHLRVQLSKWSELLSNSNEVVCLLK